MWLSQDFAPEGFSKSLCDAFAPEGFSKSLRDAPAPEGFSKLMFLYIVCASTISVSVGLKAVVVHSFGHVIDVMMMHLIIIYLLLR